MKRKLLSVVFVLLAMILSCLGFLAYQGHVRYQREIERLSVKEAVGAYTSREDYVPFDQIDEDFVNAVISVEDKRFFSRKGYDLIALIRAVLHNARYGSMVEGGSTISEQIAKNLYLDGYVDGLEEKAAEIFLMFDLEDAFSKEELFALYANMNYYGDGFWGIKEAAEGYYGKRSDDLSLAQAAILAGIPNAPAVYQLSDGFEDAKGRQTWVLQTMENNGFISQEELDEALKEDVHPIIKNESRH